MDPRDKEMIARKLHRQANTQRDVALRIAEEHLLGGLFMTKADVTYEVAMSIYGALTRIALDFEEKLPR